MNLSAIQLNSGVVPWPQAVQSTTAITAIRVRYLWERCLQRGRVNILTVMILLRTPWQRAVAILHEAPLELELIFPHIILKQPMFGVIMRILPIR